jgi:hypothetical protein
MPNESNEFASWRNLLQQAAVPELGLADKEAAWDTLFARLNRRPRRRYTFRIAAACLLIALIPAGRISREPGTLRQLPASRQAVTAVQATAAAGPTPATETPKSPAATHLRRAKAPISLQSNVAAESAKIVVAPEQLATVIAPPVIAQAPKSAPKKVWKVVDLNELDPSHARPQGMVADRQPIQLRIDLKN